MKEKYELEKYNGMKSRYECPACHHKKVFSRYIDTVTGRYLSDEVGRCNREDKCGYHYTPGQYFKDHPEEKTAPANRSEFMTSYRPIKRNMSSQSHSIDCIPKEYITKSIGYNSAFILFLCSLFDRYTLESPTIVRLMCEYYFGYAEGGAVIFWQVDAQNRIRTGKIMQYDPKTGKRIKNANGAIDWVHAKLKRSGILSETWELSQCLFGEHLLRRRPADTVCLVESEKSAIIGSGIMPEYVWLATGGKQNLKADKCECLKGRDVILFPDLGAFDEWKEKGEDIARRVGFTFTVSDILERVSTPQDRYNGLDVADYLIREIKSRSQVVNTRQIDCMDTEKTVEKRSENKLNTNSIPVASPVDEGYILQQMIYSNPTVLQLIDVFDLVSATTGQKLGTRIN